MAGVREVQLVLESLVGHLEGAASVQRSENQAAVHIPHVVSNKPHLQEAAMKIFRTCMRLGICLPAECVRKQENQLADYHSKVADEDDWQPFLFMKVALQSMLRL